MKDAGDFIRDLQDELVKRFHQQLSARLRCDPAVVGAGGAIVVQALIFAPANVLAGLDPVLECKEVGGLGGRRLRQVQDRAGSREYELQLPAGDLGVGSFRLTLHPSPGAEAIAFRKVRVVQGGLRNV